MKLKHIIFILLLTISYALSQNTIFEKYKLALSLEKAGDFQSAERLYVELYNLEKRNKEYFNGIVRTKNAQNKYSELLPFIQEQIQYESTTELYSLFAETYWKIGKDSEAKSAWAKAIEINPKVEQTYLSVAASQSSVRQFDLAILTLQKAKSMFNESFSISEELIKLYLITHKYEIAIEEIFRQFNLTKNLNNTQAKLSLLISNDELIPKIEQKLKFSTFYDNRELKLLAIWFYRSIKKYDKAFEIVKDLDKQQKSNGYEVINFANSTLSDAEYDIAIKAFEYVISLGKKSPYFVNAIYGIAKANDAKITEQENYDKKNIMNIIEQYKKIIQEHLGNQIGFEIQYRIAVLFLKYLQDFNQAESYLQQLTNIQNNPFFLKSLLLYGDLALFRKDFNTAIERYRYALKLASIQKKSDYFIAINQLAKVFYYKSDFDSSQFYFSKLLEDAPSEFSSAALTKLIFIEQNKNFNFILSNIALSELETQINRLDSALFYLNLAKEKAEGTELSAYIDLEIAKLYFKKGDFSTALSLFKEFSMTYPESLYFEESLYLLGTTYLKLGNKTEAVAVFTELLTKYPRSIYSTKARVLLNSLQNK